MRLGSVVRIHFIFLVVLGAPAGAQASKAFSREKDSLRIAIGLSGNPFVAMRLGPRPGAEMKRALALGPDNLRVWLLRGINTMHTPRIWGGGLGRAEQYLRKAQALFTTDTAHPPNPSWGRVDVEIALGQLHLMQNRREAARADFARALILAPENSWLRDTLMREAVRQDSSLSSP